MARSIFEIIESFREGLKSTGSVFAEFSNYSNIYSLYKSIAGVIVSQEAELNKVKNSYFIKTAKGRDLDNKAEDFNIKRKIGSPSTGSILVKGGTLRVGTILTSPAIKTQFEVVGDSIVNTGSNLLENIQTIKSLSNTSLANLEAGTRLYSAFYPNTVIVVGRYKNPTTQKVEGSLKNGYDTESDDNLRNRILSYLSTRAKSTKEALTNTCLGVESVSRVFIKEHVPVTGYITVYIDSQSIETVRRVKEVVERDKAAGVCALVKSIQSLKVDIVLEVTTNTDKPERLIEEIKIVVNRYVQGLDIGETLTREGIAGVVINQGEVSNCRVLNPIGAIRTKPEQIIEVESIKVILNIKG